MSYLVHGTPDWRITPVSLARTALYPADPRSLPTILPFLPPPFVSSGSGFAYSNWKKCRNQAQTCNVTQRNTTRRTLDAGDRLGPSRRQKPDLHRDFDQNTWDGTSYLNQNRAAASLSRETGIQLLQA